MRPKLIVLAFVLATLTLALVATVAYADEQRKARAALTGYEENPSISTAGRGDFRATINEDTRTIDFRLTYTPLTSSTVTQAHIHFSQRGVNGGIVAWLCGGGPRPLPPCPSSGKVEGTITPADIVATASPQGISNGNWDEVVAAIRAGVTYANVHTSAFPSGEIRGQINDRNGANDRDND